MFPAADEPRQDDRPPVRLVASPEPRVVFADLATKCVPDFCDACTIDLDDASGAQHRIAYPHRTDTARGLVDLSQRAGPTEHTLQMPFDCVPAQRALEQEPNARRDSFHGLATFVWQRRTVTCVDRVMAGVLVDHAVRTVEWQRCEQTAHAAMDAAANLRIALETSRQIGTAIGILMSLHKITADDAFELLRMASQRSNRKLRDLAHEVIDTGWLDPALVLRGSGSGARPAGR